MVEQRKVVENDGSAVATQLNAIYLETSAFTGHNIELLFQNVAETALTSDAISADQAPLAPVIDANHGKKKRCNC
jgi:hypothetical protein